MRSDTRQESEVFSEPLPQDSSEGGRCQGHHSILVMGKESESDRITLNEPNEPVHGKSTSAPVITHLVNSSRWPLHKFRHEYREYLAEFIGTMILIFFGNGVVATTFFQAGDSITVQTNANFLAITTGWGLAITIALYASMGISGGHLNPAVTIALSLFKMSPWRKVPGFIMAQILGAMTGSACMYGIFRDHFAATEMKLAAGQTMIQSVGGIFCTYPNVGNVSAAWSEFINTAVLLVAVLCIGNNKMIADSTFKPAAVGLIVFAIGLNTGWCSGYAINPARDLGPRIISAMLYGGEAFTRSDYYFLIPMLVPIAGAIAGTLIFTFLVIPV